MKRVHDFDWFQVRWLAGYGWIMARSVAVVVVPFAPDGRIWMMRTRRPAAGITSWEVPGGGVDGGESIVAAGLRELEEECGLVATGRVTAMRPVFEMAPGMGTFPHRIVVARGVVPKGKRAVAQAEEGILAIRRFTLEAARRMARRGAVSASATLVALGVVEPAAGGTTDEAQNGKRRPRSRSRRRG